MGAWGATESHCAGWLQPHFKERGTAAGGGEGAAGLGCRVGRWHGPRTDPTVPEHVAAADARSARAWLAQGCFRPEVTASPSPWQVAVANLGEAVQDADLLVFVIPHQFIHRICDEITGRVPKDALGITLIKVRRPLATRGLRGTCLPLSSAGEKELRGGDGWFGFVF